ncbi:phospholipase A2 [Kineococcus terrestris]|uniref:phospholipase A2 n=1 Tax=Kineococcus terrestris TaxID=2044856 RepID=UPI0034DB4881
MRGGSAAGAAAAAVVACALAGAVLAAPAAAAAPPAASFTVDGLTYTWSAPDGSDMAVRATPGAPDTPVPAAADPAAPPRARFLGAPAVPAGPSTDYCTSSPDSFLGADFRPACTAHDVCYSPGGSTARRACDEAFLVDLRTACAVAFGPVGALALACRAAAVVYHRTVRVVSRPWYRAAGDPA